MKSLKGELMPDLIIVDGDMVNFLPTYYGDSYAIGPAKKKTATGTVMMKNPKWQMHRGRNRQYYLRLFARNGCKILSGEGDRSKTECWNGSRSAKKNAVVDKRYPRKAASGGRSYLVLLSPNGKDRCEPAVCLQEAV